MGGRCEPGGESVARSVRFVVSCWACYYAAYMGSSLLHHAVAPWLTVMLSGGRFEGFRLEADGYGYAIAQLPAEAGTFVRVCFYGGGLGMQVVVGALILAVARANVVRAGSSGGAGRSRTAPALWIVGWVLAARGLEKTLWAALFRGPNVDAAVWSLGDPAVLKWAVPVVAAAAWIALEVFAVRRWCDRAWAGGRRRAVRLATLLVAIGVPVWTMAVVFPYRRVYFTGGHWPPAILSIAHAAVLVLCAWPEPPKKCPNEPSPEEAS